MPSTPDNTPMFTARPRWMRYFHICLCAALVLALAMGVGRFAFTPMFPLMVRDGLLDVSMGSWLAASNYLGYLMGALLATQVRASPLHLWVVSLLGIVLLTLGMGWTSSWELWALMRWGAGVCSAGCLVGVSAWALALLGSQAPALCSGLLYSGVGFGILASGLFCLWVPGTGASAATLWVMLGGLSTVVALCSACLARSARAVEDVKPTPEPATTTATASSLLPSSSPARMPPTTALVVCYGITGFGYILPATYLPALARELMDDPSVFGWSWPIFGLAAALSTLLVTTVGRSLHRMQLWLWAQALLSLGVLLPSLWLNLTTVAISALCVGGTFMVITMTAMQQARLSGLHNPTRALAAMTAAFAAGQLSGPVVSALLLRMFDSSLQAWTVGLQIAAAALALSVAYLWHIRSPIFSQKVST